MSGIRGDQVDVGANGIDTASIAPGALAASTLGRAIMEAGFFDTEAMFSEKVLASTINGNRLVDNTVATAKLQDGSVTTAKLADGVLSADAAGRAKMASAFFDLEATFSAKVNAGVINGDRLIDLTVAVAKLTASLTFAKMLLTGIKTYGFNGRTGAGAITLTGAAVGDRVFALWRTDATTLNSTTLFQTAITVVDQIQQTSASDLSLQRFVVLLVPAAA